MKPIIDFDFDSAVFAFYMEHGKPCTAKEIAAHSGASIGKVRKAISESKYRSSCTTVDRAVRERNYGSIACYRRVDAYQPSLSMMRDRIRELEKVAI